jgi:alkaline phosphatase D
MTLMSGSTRPSRRAFLGGLVAAGALAACSDDGSSTPATTTPTTEPLPPVPDLAESPFGLGVASGDPLADSVVLWTRLLVPPGTGSVPVNWEVRTDEDGDVVASGVFVTEPGHAHAVHVDVTGLEPATTYWYRFDVRDHTSPSGRTRTAPAAGTDVGSVRLALANCQAFQTGYYAAYRHMSEEDLDVVLFVGDYIYELEASMDARPHGMAPPHTLDEYRRFYEMNKADTDLQAAHAAFPWIVTWDDHEVEDNYADLEPGAIGLALDPDARDTFPERRANAYQAWWEHMPVRLPPPDEGNLRIYRSFDYGNLARLAVLDNRQYRTPLPEGEGAGNLPRGAGGGPQLPQAFDEDATYLGLEQEDWLEDVLTGSSATWNVLVQQTVMAEFDRVPDDPSRGFSMDSWDGYVAPRNRLLGLIDAEGIDNVVSLGGDIHSSLVTDLKLDYGEPGRPVVASELIGPSITALELLPEGYVETARTNPHVHYYDTQRKGYLRCEITPSEVRADYRYISSHIDPDASVETGSSWTIEAGRPGARPS